MFYMMWIEFISLSTYLNIVAFFYIKLYFTGLMWGWYAYVLNKLKV